MSAPVNKTKCTSGLNGATELIGAIRDWSLHETRQCLCRTVITDLGVFDHACHISGTPEHTELYRLRDRMQRAAANARGARRVAAGA